MAGYFASRATDENETRCRCDETAERPTPPCQKPLFSDSSLVWCLMFKVNLCQEDRGCEKLICSGVDLFDLRVETVALHNH